MLLVGSYLSTKAYQLIQSPRQPKTRKTRDRSNAPIPVSRRCRPIPIALHAIAPTPRDCRAKHAADPVVFFKKFFLNAPHRFRTIARMHPARCDQCSAGQERHSGTIFLSRAGLGGQGMTGSAATRALLSYSCKRAIQRPCKDAQARGHPSAFPQAEEETSHFDAAAMPHPCRKPPLRLAP
jgi:hypothetical protein